MSLNTLHFDVSDANSVKFEQVISDIEHELTLTLQDTFSYLNFPRVTITGAGYSEYVQGKINLSHTLIDKPAEQVHAVLKHEYIHWLIQDVFEHAPIAALDEGIAVALSDWKLRKIKLKFNQHDLCHQLYLDNLLLPMAPLFKGYLYYGLRHDFRVDLQFSSFCDYFIEKLGLTDWLKFCDEVTDQTTEIPTVNLPRIQIKLDEWIDYIHCYLPTNNHCKAYYKTLTIKSNLSLKNIHCPACNFPSNNIHKNCVACHFDLPSAHRLGLFNFNSCNFTPL